MIIDQTEIDQWLRIKPKEFAAETVIVFDKFRQIKYEAIVSEGGFDYGTSYDIFLGLKELPADVLDLLSRSREQAITNFQEYKTNGKNFS